jgi:xanthine/uracil/vitamin C permease (AzgA family)
MLGRFFKLKESHTRRTEILAGLTTSLAGNIVFVNPAQVAAGGAAVGWFGAARYAAAMAMERVYIASILGCDVGTADGAVCEAAVAQDAAWFERISAPALYPGRILRA